MSLLGVFQENMHHSDSLLFSYIFYIKCSHGWNIFTSVGLNFSQPSSLPESQDQSVSHNLYNRLQSTKGTRIAATKELVTMGEEFSLSGSPIWKRQAGEDILPSPPWDHASTRRKYHLPGDRSVQVASSVFPI